MPTAYAFSERSIAESLTRSVGPTALEEPATGVPAVLFVVKLTGALSAYSSGSAAPSADGQLLADTPSSGFVDTRENGVKQKTVKVYNVFEQDFPVDSVLVCGRLDGRLFVIQPTTYKSLVRFTLSSALATSDASKTATITNQYGFGVDNTTASGGITVHNLLTSTGGVYVFEGDSGDAGLAMWDQGTNYRIIQMECP